MTLANCSRCGTLFNRATSDVCLACHKEEEELLHETQDYIRQNPHTTMTEVMDNLEIEQEMLDRWIEEKRIQLHDPASVESKTICISCGRPVKEGERFCKTCMFKQLAAKKTDPLSSHIQEEEEETEEEPVAARGMHVKFYR